MNGLLLVLMRLKVVCFFPLEASVAAGQLCVAALHQTPINKQIKHINESQTVRVVCPEFLSFLAVTSCAVLSYYMILICLFIIHYVFFILYHKFKWLSFLVSAYCYCKWFVIQWTYSSKLLQAMRRRGRTPTPGRYLGLRTVRGKIACILCSSSVIVICLLVHVNDFFFKIKKNN